MELWVGRRGNGVRYAQPKHFMIPLASTLKPGPMGRFNERGHLDLNLSK
jgi:hypothetical protein